MVDELIPVDISLELLEKYEELSVEKLFFKEEILKPEEHAETAKVKTRIANGKTRFFIIVFPPDNMQNTGRYLFAPNFDTKCLMLNRQKLEH